MKYKLQDKKDRNERLYKFYKNHPKWTLRAIAKQYKISATRVYQIIKQFKDKELITE